jgi:hypothetical protein
MRALLGILIPFAAAACEFTIPSQDDGGVTGGTRTIAGTVVDFETGVPIAGVASISTAGLAAPPTITTQGSSFTLSGVPDNSVFQILVSAPLAYRTTFSDAVVVGTEDLVEVRVRAVREAFLGDLATAFGITPSAARGVLLGRVVDSGGAPKPGVAASNFVIDDAGVRGPYFLGDNLQPLPTASATSASGWSVLFEVSPGLVSLGQNALAQVTLDMPISPVGPGTVTIAQIHATNGTPMLPANVSFQMHVMPIFKSRGCVACHSGTGPGKDLGGLTLDGGASLTYKELTAEAPQRVLLSTPEKSLLLTRPSREDPPDSHPNVTFSSPRDPDYVKILVWIREGAQQN